MDDDAPIAGLGHNMPPPPTREERFADLVADVEALAQRGTKLPVTIGSDADLSGYAEVVNAARRLIDSIDATRRAENEPHRQAQTDNNAFFGAHVDRLKRMRSILEERTTDYNEAKAAAERRRRAEEAARIQAEADARAAAAAEAGDGIEGEIARDTAVRADERAAHAAAQAAGSRADMVRTRTAGGTVSSRTVLAFKVPDYTKIDLRELHDSFGVDAIDKAIREHIKRHKKTRPLTGIEIFETSKASFRG